MQLENKIRPASSRLAELASLMAPPTLSERTLVLSDGPARLRLEDMVWDGLDEVARREGRPVTDLCGELDATKPGEVELTTAIRTFVLHYYRQADGV